MPVPCSLMGKAWAAFNADRCAFAISMSWRCLTGKRLRISITWDEPGRRSVAKLLTRGGGTRRTASAIP